MLFVLKQVEGPRLFYVFSGNDYLIARKNGSISLPDDQSISRKHAIIKVGQNSAILMDLESKYGTSRNNLKLDPNQEVTLEDNDIIKFGVYQSKFKLEKINLVITGSGLTNEQKTDLKKKIASIGGTFVSEWDSRCAYLTAKEIILTVKVLHAVIDGKPIVDLNFWDEYIKKIKMNEPLPDPQNFKPPITESLINGVDLSVNDARKILFKNKIFVFPTEKLKLQMNDLIEKTGGSCISWEKQPLNLLQVTKSKKSYIFIYVDDSQNPPQSLKDIYDHIKKLGERTISLQEIPKAILLCSCEKDCNPKFNRLLNVFMDQNSNSDSAVFPLASETQESVLEQNILPKIEQIIPQSLDEDLNMLAPQLQAPKEVFVAPSTSKRKQETEVVAAKKPKLVQATITTSSCSSRKRKGDESVAPSPKKTLVENPFAVMNKITRKNPVADNNPFASLRLKKEVIQNVDNPFRNVEEPVEQPIKPPEGSTSTVRDTPDNVIQNSCLSNLSNITWLSKKEIKNISNSSFEVEEEFKEIFDCFKDTLIIEFLPASAIKKVPLNQTLDVSNTSVNGKNFKKFKKVRPLRPQINITTTTFMPNTYQTQVESGSANGNVVESDSEEEEIRRPVVRITNKSRRFEF